MFSKLLGLLEECALPIDESLIMLTISVLEDNLILRDRFRSIIIEWESVSDCFVFEENHELIEHSLYQNYDVALIDLDLPDGSGLQSIEHLARTQPSACIIVISALSDAESIYTAIESGAIGYIHKDDNSLTLQSSIEMALRGESPISPMIARKVFSRIQNLTFIIQSKSDTIDKHILTNKESQVLQLLAKGLSYNETASVLEMSQKTVPTHIRNIYKKLQVNSRSEAVYEARQMGIID